jgi:hypothetical protein
LFGVHTPPPNPVLDVIEVNSARWRSVHQTTVSP